MSYYSLETGQCQLELKEDHQLVKINCKKKQGKRISVNTTLEDTNGTIETTELKLRKGAFGTRSSKLVQTIGVNTENDPFICD